MNDTPIANSEVPVVLTINGSDSGGGGGIQADLKTFAAMDVYGTTVVTCIAAQTPSEVREVFALSPDLVTEQIRSVSNGFPIAAAKTGVLYSADIIRRVARADVNQGFPILVVDPVMTASSGARLLQSDAMDALKNELLPLARIITPNVHELEILSGRPITSLDELKEGARELSERYDVACVATGGGLPGDECVDVLYDEGDWHLFSGPRLPVLETHGAGCVFSAALTAGVARGMLMTEAVQQARELVQLALSAPLSLGHHHPLNIRKKAPTTQASA